MKYAKDTKIRKYILGSSGKWTNYQSAIPEEELQMLRYAESKGLCISGNDAPRGGKRGEYFLIAKAFDFDELQEQRAKELEEKEALLKQILKSEIISEFRTISDMGNFVIDGVSYSNFYGNGWNRVEICFCNEAEFKSAKYLTRREIYNAKEPISIVRFDAPKTITVAHSDSDKHFGETKIGYVLGFVIWRAKLKVFVSKKS